MVPLMFLERPASAQAEGLLILHHGRGADERDLLSLGDALDPERRLHIATPRAPLTLPRWAGHHWYVVPRVGFPDPVTFGDSYRALAAFHDQLWASTQIPAQRTVLGGFSMGTVMSYALGLGADRPAVAGILAFSGFIPVVEGWRPAFNDRRGQRTFIAHGRNDPVIPVEFGRHARDRLESEQLTVEYHESGAAHHLDPSQLPLAADWLTATLGGS
jgi:phospholipase/carboxylesterase